MENRNFPKRTLSAGLLVIFFLFGLWTSGHAKTITIKIGTSSPVSKITLDTIEGGGLSSEHNTVALFKKIVESKTNGQIQCIIYPNCQLGDEAELWQSTQQGMIQMTSATTAPLSAMVPEYMPFAIPFLVDSPEIMYRVLDGPLGRKMRQMVIDKIGVRMLDWSFVGSHVFFNNKREIKSPADLKGLKMRVIQTPEIVKMIEGMGAQAVPIGWSELYTAAQQGVIDGLCTPPLMAAQGKLYEVQKYLTMAGNRLEAFSLSINEKFYQSLSDEHKKIIEDAASKSLLLFRACLYLGESLWVDKFQSDFGLKVYYPTSEQLAQFRKVALDASIPYMKSKVGEKWVDEVVQAVEKATAEYYAQ